MDIFDKKPTYYEEKITTLLKEFTKLFLKMLEDKKCNNLNQSYYFSDIANKTKEYYPEIKEKIDTVLYYYVDEDDNEEKLENLMKLYKIIKENIYGNRDAF